MDNIDFYFDDSGFTGEDLSNPEQRNFIFAGFAINQHEKATFWDNVGEGWLIAAEVLKVQLQEIELKGEHLYGGKGNFKGIALERRCRILEAIIGTFESQNIRIYWEGVPKHLWEKENIKVDGKPASLFKSALLAFGNSVYEVLHVLHPSSTLCFIGDENTWVKAGYRLDLKKISRWPMMEGQGIGFLSSTKERGLQIADILVHTLYRTNKDQLNDPNLPAVELSNTDKLAKSYHARLAKAQLLCRPNWVITQANKALEQRRLKNSG